MVRRTGEDLGAQSRRQKIALSVTTASPLFGRAPASEKNVLLLALEDNERRLQERITKCSLAPTDRLCLTTRREYGLSGLTEFLLENPDIKLCIIDTLAVFSPSQDTKGRNTYDADVARMRELHNLGRDTGTSLLMIHHDKQGEDSDWASKMNGSSGVIGTADTLIRLSVQKRGSKQAKLVDGGTSFYFICLLASWIAFLRAALSASAKNRTDVRSPFACSDGQTTEHLSRQARTDPKSPPRFGSEAVSYVLETRRV